MPIFKNSRYTKTSMYNHDGNVIFRRRNRFKFSTEKSTLYVFKESDRLDNLARDFYGDAQLWWVLLDANPHYRSEIDINYGDVLTVPSFEEVMKCLT